MDSSLNSSGFVAHGPQPRALLSLYTNLDAFLASPSDLV